MPVIRIHSLRRTLLSAVVTALLGAIGLPSLAQDAAPPAESPRLSVEEAQARQERLRASTGLDEAAKAPLLEKYAAALTQLASEQEWSAKAAQFAQYRDEAPRRIEEITDILDQPAEASGQEPGKDASLIDLMQTARQKQAELEAAKTAQDEISKEPQRRAERRQQIPDQTIDLMRRAEEARARASLPRGDGESDDSLLARQTEAQAQWQALEAERNAYETELSWYDAAGALLYFEQDLAQHRLRQCQEQADLWNDALSLKREEEAQRANQEALEAVRLAMNQDVPWIREQAKSLADETQTLAKRRSGPDGLIAKIDGAATLLETVRERHTKLEADFADARGKTKSASANVGAGLLLRTYRRDLPDIAALRADIGILDGAMAETQYATMLLKDSRKEMADIPRLVNNLADRVSVQQAGAEKVLSSQAARTSFRKLFQRLHEQKRDALVSLIDDYGKYEELLFKLQQVNADLILKTQEFAAYIDERVLWMRSTHPIGLNDVLGAPDSAAWLLDRNHAKACIDGFRQDLKSNPGLYLAAISCALLAFAARIRLPRRLSEHGEMAAKRHCQVFLPTAEATAITLLLGSVPALAAWFLGWRLEGMTVNTEAEFERALAEALHRSAVLLLMWGWSSYILRARGLAEAHFDWPAPVARSIRRRVTFAALLEAALLFPVTLLEWARDEQLQAALGRPLFLAAMAVMVWLSHSLLRSGKGPVWRLPALLTEQPRSAGWQRVWYWTMVAVPLALMGLASAGYLYTAIRLSWRFHGTALLLLGLFLVRGLARRALVIVRRRMAREQARRRREQLSAESAGEELDLESGVDLDVVDAQTQGAVRTLFNFAVILGLWIVWADVLPALAVLDRIELWHVAGDAPVVAQDGTPSIPGASLPAVAPQAAEAPAEGAAVPPQSLDPAASGSEPLSADKAPRQPGTAITLSRLLLALLAGVLTVMVVRNLPGLLEVTVLRRLSLATGERYAITSIATYTLTAIGVVTAFSMLGVGWNKVQWLVAAMGVGLGFGLQEIFANFVSGIIMLFERPVRIGDTVTIGGVHGTVTRIRIRATRILDWDRKELIVPNKEFIMGQLINWTLSDPSVRLVVPIGIAYGSNTEKALEVMRRAVEEQCGILHDTEPQVLFLGFGDSALLFEIRAHIGELSELPKVRHELLMRLDRDLRQEGIEIPFPQRDIHIRTMPESGPAALPSAEDTAPRSGA